MAHPLYVAFIWHQHQPDYRDPFGGPAHLPWARLHAAKDYVHMAELVGDWPAIHCTFNYVPSLADQVAAIGTGEYVDAWQLLSLKESWSREDKQFLLDHFFSIHPRLLERYPAYVRLREHKAAPEALPDQYFLDLAAWFNLAWIDPRAIARDPTLSTLAAKAENFTCEDISAIINRHRELAARVIPLHKELAARGQIELSVSPYYHPILPLLIDQRSAREAVANVTLPVNLFVHPEDAAEQLRRAVEAHRAHFGTEPAGLWPSEGSVSDALPGILPNNFRWFASDENILARSLGKPIQRDGDGHVTNPRVLYQPFAVGAKPPSGRARSPVETNRLSAIFRDHVLSDRIGFAYQYLSGSDAANDLIYRLHVIRDRLADLEHAYLVSIILDGENAWESYEDNGDPFFRALYGALSNDPTLKTVTVGEYLRQNPPRQRIKRVAAGSWINGNFDTWIGEPTQNRAWDLVADAREALTTWQREYAMADEQVIGRAYDELYIAEGSDWYWWYSSRNSSAQDAMFDTLFRGHLQNIYALIGLPVPDPFKQPIYKLAAPQARGITAAIMPRLAAEPEAGAEWNGAAALAPEAAGGTMQRADAKIRRVFIGYNSDEFFFRCETAADVGSGQVCIYLATPGAEQFNDRPRGSESEEPLALTWEIVLQPGAPPDGSSVRTYRAEGQEIWKETPTGVRGMVQARVSEIALPLKEVGLKWGDDIGILVTLLDLQKNAVVERLPAHGLQFFTLGEF